MSTTNATLTGPGPRHSPEFQQFLDRQGELGRQFSTLKAEKRLYLWNKFKSERRTDDSPAKRMRDDLIERYGVDYESRMNPAEKVALSRAIAQSQTTSPELPGLSPERRLENYHLRQQIAESEARMQGLRASRGGGFNVEMSRRSAIDHEEQAIAKMRARLGIRP